MREVHVEPSVRNRIDGRHEKLVLAIALALLLRTAHEQDTESRLKARQDARGKEALHELRRIEVDRASTSGVKEGFILISNPWINVEGIGQVVLGGVTYGYVTFTKNGVRLTMMRVFGLGDGASWATFSQTDESAVH